TGPVSAMGRLDCKEPSLIALKGLARDADEFALIGEEGADAILAPLAAEGLATTPSGGAGLAPLLSTEARKALGLDDGARVFAVVSEAPL
ncbi:MAG: PLP-dependent lyase/thiolase, partial [Pseudomonadota bacterium]